MYQAAGWPLCVDADRTGLQKEGPMEHRTTAKLSPPLAKDVTTFSVTITPVDFAENEDTS